MGCQWSAYPCWIQHGEPSVVGLGERRSALGLLEEMHVLRLELPCGVVPSAHQNVSNRSSTISFAIRSLTNLPTDSKRRAGPRRSWKSIFIDSRDITMSNVFESTVGLGCAHAAAVLEM